MLFRWRVDVAGFVTNSTAHRGVEGSSGNSSLLILPCHRLQEEDYSGDDVEKIRQTAKRLFTKLQEAEKRHQLEKKDLEVSVLCVSLLEKCDFSSFLIESLRLEKPSQLTWSNHPPPTDVTH